MNIRYAYLGIGLILLLSLLAFLIPKKPMRTAPELQQNMASTTAPTGH